MNEIMAKYVVMEVKATKERFFLDNVMGFFPYDDPTLEFDGSQPYMVVGYGNSMEDVKTLLNV